MRTTRHSIARARSTTLMVFSLAVTTALAVAAPAAHANRPGARSASKPGQSSHATTRSTAGRRARNDGLPKRLAGQLRRRATEIETNKAKVAHTLSKLSEELRDSALLPVESVTLLSFTPSHLGTKRITPGFRTSVTVEVTPYAGEHRLALTRRDFVGDRQVHTDTRILGTAEEVSAGTAETTFEAASGTYLGGLTAREVQRQAKQNLQRLIEGDVRWSGGRKKARSDSDRGE